MRWKLKNVENGRFLGDMVSLKPYFLVKNGRFGALFAMRWKLKKVENGRFLGKMVSL